MSNLIIENPIYPINVYYVPISEDAYGTQKEQMALLLADKGDVQVFITSGTKKYAVDRISQQGASAIHIYADAPVSEGELPATYHISYSLATDACISEVIPIYTDDIDPTDEEAYYKMPTASAVADYVEEYVSTNAIKYMPQTLTELQKAQARENIGAAKVYIIEGMEYGYFDGTSTPTDEWMETTKAIMTEIYNAAVPFEVMCEIDGIRYQTQVIYQKSGATNSRYVEIDTVYNDSGEYLNLTCYVNRTSDSLRLSATEYFSNTITADDKNAVQGSVIKSALDDKQDKLIAGQNITLTETEEGTRISASGGGTPTINTTTIVDLTLTESVDLSSPPTYFGDTAILGRTFWYLNNGRQVKAKAIYGYIYNDSGTSITVPSPFSAYYADGTPSGWSFGDLIGANVGIVSITQSNQTVADKKYFQFYVVLDCVGRPVVYSGTNDNLAFSTSITMKPTPFNSFSHTSPHMSGLKLGNGTSFVWGAGTKIHIEVVEEA